MSGETEGLEFPARMFLAVGLDEDLRHGLAAFLTEHLAADGIPGTPVSPQNWHITLRFLGNVAEREYGSVLAALDEADLGAAFILGFAGLGAFPRPSRATVLWVGVDQGGDALRALAVRCEAAIVRAGFPPEEREISGHLTISRIRRGANVTDIVAGVPRFPLKQRVDEIGLYRSRLGRGGARYSLIERFRLD